VWIATPRILRERVVTGMTMAVRNRAPEGLKDIRPSGNSAMEIPEFGPFSALVGGSPPRYLEPGLASQSGLSGRHKGGVDPNFKISVLFTGLPAALTDRLNSAKAMKTRSAFFMIFSL
jgi:hypothetical protein